MDRDLRLRMLLQASDRVTRPLRDIAGGARSTNEALRATHDRLKDLKRAQGDVAAFRQLRTGLTATERDLQAAQTHVGGLAREMRATENPTKKMAREFATAQRQAAALKTEHQAQSAELQRLRGRLGEAGISTNNLAQHERELRTQISRTNDELSEQARRLQVADTRRQRLSNARDTFSRTQAAGAATAATGAAAIGTGIATARPLIGIVGQAQQFESVMTDIAQKADLGRNAAARMGRELLAASKAANQLPEDLLKGVDALTGLGAKPDEAVQMMRPIGRAATAYKAEIADLGNAAWAAHDNLKVPLADTGKMIDAMAQAGKSGAFEVKDMAQYFPTLTAAYQGLGQAGVNAGADLAAAAQITRKGAGDSATAATNLANILQKITSPATIRAFDKFGVDLPKALQKAYREGKTPIEAIAELTNKTLKGDLGKLGFLFEDAQVQQGLRPLIQNMDEYRQIRAEAIAAANQNTTTDTDFAERMKDSAEQTKALKVNAAALGVTLGSMLLPTVNAVVQKANLFAAWIGNAAKRHPVLTRALLIGAGALSAFFLLFGAGAIAIAGIMGPIALLNAGLIAMGVAGGTASIGLLPIIGTVLLVIAAVAALAAAAYLIYKNWGAITAFFSQLWSGVQARFASASAAITGVFQGMWTAVKSLFSMSLLDIGNSIAGMIGFALGALYRFGAAAFGWLTGTLPGLLSSGWAAAWAAFTGAISAAWMWLTTRLPAMLVSGWNAAWAAFKAAMRAAFVTLPALFFDFGAMIIKGLWNGIKSAPARLWNAGKSLANALSGGFQKGAEIHSPSRVFMALGGHIIGGLNVGLDRGRAGAVGRITRLTKDMAKAAAVPVMTAGLMLDPSAAAAQDLATRARGMNIVDTRARAPASSGTYGSGSSGGPGARGGSSPAAGDRYEVHFHPAPGMDEQKLFNMFTRWMAERGGPPKPGSGASYDDPPDWS